MRGHFSRSSRNVHRKNGKKKSSNVEVFDIVLFCIISPPSVLSTFTKFRNRNFYKPRNVWGLRSWVSVIFVFLTFDLELRLQENRYFLILLVICNHFVHRCIAPGQEVLAETTYPADQTVGLALMSLFGFVKVSFIFFTLIVNYNS